MCRVPRGELLQRRGVYLADAVPPGLLLGHPWGGPDVQGVPQGHVPGEPWCDVVLLVVSGEWRVRCLLDGAVELTPDLVGLELC